MGHGHHRALGLRKPSSGRIAEGDTKGLQPVGTSHPDRLRPTLQGTDKALTGHVGDLRRLQQGQVPSLGLLQQGMGQG